MTNATLPRSCEEYEAIDRLCGSVAFVLQKQGATMMRCGAFELHVREENRGDVAVELRKLYRQ